jgi:hypothetical protein
LQLTVINYGFASQENLRKIVFLILLFLSYTLRISAPGMNFITIFEFPPVEPYKQLALAIGIVETKNDTIAYNIIEEAAGYFQIRPIRLLDYNNRTGSNYAMKDLFNYEISEKIFLFYADQIGPYDFELIARKWNGNGRLTINYWNKIKKYL